MIISLWMIFLRYFKPKNGTSVMALLIVIDAVPTVMIILPGGDEELSRSDLQLIVGLITAGP